MMRRVWRWLRQPNTLSWPASAAVVVWIGLVTMSCVLWAFYALGWRW